MKLSYFPGCSLTGTAAEYDHSIRQVARALDIELVELPDWSCCGASSGHMTDHQLGIELSARNLLIAQEAKHDLLVPCAACFQRLKAAQHALTQDPQRFGIDHFELGFQILHLTRLLSRPQILKTIKNAVDKPLAGLRLACYYGCLALRPPEITQAPDFENPQGLDELVQALGAEPVRWSHKTECCSGSLTMARPDIARALIKDVVEAAKRGGAAALVTDCPMCQANLESRQLDLQKGDGLSTLPVFFGTELVGVALGQISMDKKGFAEHLIDPLSVLHSLDIRAD